MLGEIIIDGMDVLSNNLFVIVFLDNVGFIGVEFFLGNKEIVVNYIMVYEVLLKRK